MQDCWNHYCIFLKKISLFVDGVSNGNDALDYALTNNYDGLVLDVMMPDLTVLRFWSFSENRISIRLQCFWLQRQKYISVLKDLMQARTIIFQSRFQPRSCLQGYGLCWEERNNYVPNIIKFNGLNLNCTTYELSCNALNVILSGKELQIMEMLIQRPNYSFRQKVSYPIYGDGIRIAI